jgi:CheY-like chemotaxis protein/anti-sigma regulatory factor (Ser/Thr protein kinase)
MTGVAMDITDRKEAEAARQTLAHSERLRALGQMASGIAHDLNQSLALITGYSDMIRLELSASEAPDLARVREMVEITARAAFEGGQALKGLLGFVRTQELMAEAVRFEVAEVLQEAARLTAPRWRDASQAEGRPIHLRVEAASGLAVHGSPGALREAITNLIFNAVDALPRGGEIVLRARRSSDQAVIEVSDTGTGIPREVQARIFDPFFTTKGERGTGLGLPQVAAIVERHAGSIELDSEPGRGTTFRLRFPLAATQAEHTAGEAAEHAPPPSGPQRAVRILVVEDEQQLARMAGMVLTQRGHQVVVVESFEEAMQHLEQQRFELIISDLGLGTGKNGWDLAQAVRERWPATRFVLVTGWGAAIDPKEAQARGVHEVIAKPYRIADLRQIAERVAAAPNAE